MELHTAMDGSTSAASRGNHLTSSNGKKPVSLSQNASSVSMRWAKSFPTLVASSSAQYSCVWCKKSFDRRCDRK
jgi:hypothetical protein